MSAKTKSLKNRVSAYARGMAHTNAVARMIAETANMEVRHHRHRDRGVAARIEPDQSSSDRATAILLRDDKSAYIFLSGDHPAPQITQSTTRLRAS